MKVEVDLTKPLPSIVEFERESGEVVELSVHYPWVPPTCSHCHELGHIVRNCFHYSPSRAEPPATAKKGNKNSEKITKKYQPVASSSQPMDHEASNSKVASLPQSTPSKAVPISLVDGQKSPLRPVVPLSGTNTDPIPMETSSAIILTSNPKPFCPFSTPDPHPRPSLKRSRSSPTLSPPQTTNPNPFILLKTPLKTLTPFNSLSHVPSLNDHPKKISILSTNSFSLMDLSALSGDPTNLS